MPSISSPIAYPPSSSPPQATENRKRPRAPDEYGPAKRKLFGRTLGQTTRYATEKILNEISGNHILPPKNVSTEPLMKHAGPFLDDSEEENEENCTADATMDGFQSPTPEALSIPMKMIPQDCDNSRDPAYFSGLVRLTSGKRIQLQKRSLQGLESYEQLIAQRSIATPGKAKTSYYGIEIHRLINEANNMSERTPKSLVVSHEDECRPSVEPTATAGKSNKSKNVMWTERYRAKKFTDLVGDERTHRTVLRWLKGWDPIVFPGISKRKLKSKFQEDSSEERVHRKILLLTGPPGLGKTTLAHVCARQAGYEVVEINASDERSREVVKGRIRDSVGTENVRGVNIKTSDGTIRKAGRPVCVVIDEVDGVVGGSHGGGEGGFMKALVDLVTLDQKNSSPSGLVGANAKKFKKGDQFRMLRPMILICNDVYHPALRPLRASNLAEIIHIRKPPLDKVVARMKSVFDREHLPSDSDGIRRLCEATWGISNRKESRSSNNTGEGDLRSILVVSEWVARKLRSSSSGNPPRLTRQWIEKNVLDDLSHGGGGARGVGRGGAKEAANRVFLDGAGFPKSTIVKSEFDKTSILGGSGSGSGSGSGVTNSAKQYAMARLRDIIDTSGEPDRILTDVFTAYPSHPFQDDTFLSKPNAAYDWLHFHDTLSSKVYTGQEWELNPYLSQAILGFHHLFASPSTKSWTDNEPKPYGAEEDDTPLPFSGPRADFEAFEALKENRSQLVSLQSALSVPLLRSFRSPEEIATDLLPQVIRMLTPDVKPVIVGGSGETRGTASVRREAEREMVNRSVGAMSAVGVVFERSRIEDAKGAHAGFVYRMEPPLDTLSSFATFSKPTSTATTSSSAPMPLLPTRYAVRQVLDQEFQKYLIQQRASARLARYQTGRNPLDPASDDEEKVLRGDRTSKSSLPKNPMSKPLRASTLRGPGGPKRDFFGRIIAPPSQGEESRGAGGTEAKLPQKKAAGGGGRIWVSYNEGFSNAVRKPIGLAELMGGL